MPGLLTVGVPYVTEAFNERIGVAGDGHVRVRARRSAASSAASGVALLTAATSWRVALGAVAALPLAATLVMRRSLPPGDAGAAVGRPVGRHPAPAARQPRARWPPA